MAYANLWCGAKLTSEQTQDKEAALEAEPGLINLSTDISIRQLNQLQHFFFLSEINKDEGKRYHPKRKPQKSVESHTATESWSWALMNEAGCI